MPKRVKKDRHLNMRGSFSGIVANEPESTGSVNSGRSGGSELFPPTDWGQVQAAGGKMGTAKVKGITFIAERYRRPVFCYLRSRGHDPDEAEDLTNEFFLKCIKKDDFAKADPARGRFRSFLLTSLKHFVSNVHREAHAQKRHPPGGFIPAHELKSEEGPYIVPIDRDNPEAAFNRAWSCDLVLRVVKILEIEFQAAGMECHLDLFRQIIIAPNLQGTTAPSMEDLAVKHGLTVKQAHNRLLAARRAYQRLLREEIRSFASSEEEVTAEIQDLFRFLAKA